MVTEATHRLANWLHRRLSRAIGADQLDATKYWEARYARGGNSGEGSYGRLGGLQGERTERFHSRARRAERHRIRIAATAINCHCYECPAYTGLDISRSALLRCIERFRDDSTKSFFLFDADCFRDASGRFAADVSVSLDVIFHLVDDRVFEAYMAHACEAAQRYLILYTTDYDRPSTGHERPRAVSKWMQSRPDFVLVKRIPNPFPGTQDEQYVSDAEFLIYERQAQTLGAPIAPKTQITRMASSRRASYPWTLDGGPRFTAST